jgi:aryl-alcohol dehydrogenase-like predicted oxidoreductase
MEYTKLGRTGLDVSRICLGCMSYGGGNLGNHAWSLPEEESRPFIKKALEAGINFFDTANRYSLGNSEEILGRAIKDFARRDEVVIATKGLWPDASRPQWGRTFEEGNLRRDRQQPASARHGLRRPLSDPSFRS